MGDMHIHEKISLSMVETHEQLIRDAPLIVMDGNIGIDTMDKVLEMALKYNVPGEFASTNNVYLSRISIFL
ncbi:hypothetical protein HUJ05_003330 [Dendroctonus ponderosae]|nr:hypothetical protein HUJ05_003330 [Dendroctonus ponderosae]